MSVDQINHVLAMCATISFAVTGVLALADRRVDFFSVVVIGVITAVGGGLMRDVLSGRKTLLMSDEVYAVPVTLGILTMLVTFHFFPDLRAESLLGGTIVAFGLRSAAIYWEWRLPAWFTSGPR